MLILHDYIQDDTSNKHCALNASITTVAPILGIKNSGMSIYVTDMNAPQMVQLFEKKRAIIFQMYLWFSFG